MQEHISAGCYLLRKNGNKYELLVIHREKLLGEEKYVLPKGHQEGNEALEETAKREVTEETGYTDIEIIEKIATNDYILSWNKDVHKTDNYFLAILKSEKLIDQKLTKAEADSKMEILWMDWKDGLKILSWENLDGVFEKIEKYIFSVSE